MCVDFSFLLTLIDQKPEFITKSVYLENKQIKIWATSRPEQIAYQDVMVTSLLCI